MSEKLKEQATTAGVQDSRKAEESRSGHLGEGKCTERARLETNGCILSGAGTPKTEFRLKCGGSKLPLGESGRKFPHSKVLVTCDDDIGDAQAGVVFPAHEEARSLGLGGRDCHP